MRVSTLVRFAAACAVILILTGCAMTPGGISTSNIPTEGRPFTVVGLARNTSSRVYLFSFLPVSGGNTIRDAMNAGIRSRRGDAMINITVESYSHHWIIFSRYVTRVEGDVIVFDRK